MHLELQDCRVATFVRQDELDSIAVRHPHKLLTKDVLAYFVNDVVARETLTEVGVQSSFVSASAASAKAYRMEVSLRFVCHEGESFTSEIVSGRVD